MTTILYSTTKELWKKGHSFTVSNLRFQGRVDAHGMVFKGNLVCDATTDNKRLATNFRKIYAERLAHASECAYPTVNGALTAAVEFFKTNRLYNDEVRGKLMDKFNELVGNGVEPTDYSEFIASLNAKEEKTDFTKDMCAAFNRGALTFRELHFAFFAAKMMFEEEASKEESAVEIPAFEPGQAIEINGVLKSARLDESSIYGSYIFQIQEGEVIFVKSGSPSAFKSVAKDAKVGDSVHFYTRVKFVSKKNGLVYIDRIAKNPYKD